jgi:predicted O-methyltransferase YrrM
MKTKNEINREIKSIKELVYDMRDVCSITNKEGEFLYNTAKNCKGQGVILEIGSWKGVSTIWLARGSKAGNKVKVYTVDPHTGTPFYRKMYRKMYGNVQTFPQFQKNINRANVDDIVLPIVKTSKEAEKDWNWPIEFLWIDGNHEYESVKLDFDKWFPYLIEGGIIAFHDTLSFPGPKKVVIESLYKSKNFTNIGLIGSITFAKKVSRISFRNKLENKRDLFLRYVYELFFRYIKYVPKPIKKIIKKFLEMYKRKDT